MQGYLIDTTALSARLNEQHAHHESTVSALDSLPDDASKFVSIVTIAEIAYGIRLAEAAGSKYLADYRARLQLVRAYSLLPLTHHTSEAYAKLKSALAVGTQRVIGGKRPKRWIEDWVVGGSKLQIGENDLWICAQAKERDLTVVTGDDGIRNLRRHDSDLRVLFTW